MIPKIIKFTKLKVLEKFSLTWFPVGTVIYRISWQRTSVLIK